MKVKYNKRQAAAQITAEFERKKFLILAIVLNTLA